MQPIGIYLPYLLFLGANEEDGNREEGKNRSREDGPEAIEEEVGGDESAGYAHRLVESGHECR